MLTVAVALRPAAARASPSAARRWRSCRCRSSPPRRWGSREPASRPEGREAGAAQAGARRRGAGATGARAAKAEAGTRARSPRAEPTASDVPVPPKAGRRSPSSRSRPTPASSPGRAAPASHRKAGRRAKPPASAGTGSQPGRHRAHRADDQDGEAGRRGAPAGNPLGTSAFGSEIAGLDNPDFKFGYYIDRLLAAIDAKWVRPPLGNEVRGHHLLPHPARRQHHRPARWPSPRATIPSIWRRCARCRTPSPFPAPAAGVPRRLPGGQPDRPLASGQVT